CRVAVKPTPTSTSVMRQSDLAFQLLVIAFDAPAQFGLVDEILQRRVLRQGRKPIFRRLSFFIRPLNNEPFQRMWFGPIAITRGWAQTHSGKARGERRVRTFAPGEAAPCFFLQAQRQLLDRDGLMFKITVQTRRLAAMAAPGLCR